MALESMIFPLPSELVMPFVGFLVADHKFSLTLAIIFSSLGTLVGLGVTVVLIILRLPISYIVFGHLIGWIVIALTSLILSSRFV